MTTDEGTGVGNQKGRGQSYIRESTRRGSGFWNFRGEVPPCPSLRQFMPIAMMLLAAICHSPCRLLLVVPNATSSSWFSPLNVIASSNHIMRHINFALISGQFLMFELYGMVKRPRDLFFIFFKKDCAVELWTLRFCRKCMGLRYELRAQSPPNSYLLYFLTKLLGLIKQTCKKNLFNF